MITKSGYPVTVLATGRQGDIARIQWSDGSQSDARIQALRADTVAELETALSEAPIYTSNDVVDGKLRNV